MADKPTWLDIVAAMYGDYCGCCEISDYSPPDDEFETACENCGHSPEEHEPDF